MFEQGAVAKGLELGWWGRCAWASHLPVTFHEGKSIFNSWHTNMAAMPSQMLAHSRSAICEVRDKRKTNTGAGFCLDVIQLGHCKKKWMETRPTDFPAI